LSTNLQVLSVEDALAADGDVVEALCEQQPSGWYQCNGTYRPWHYGLKSRSVAGFRALIFEEVVFWVSYSPAVKVCVVIIYQLHSLQLFRIFSASDHTSGDRFDSSGLVLR